MILKQKIQPLVIDSDKIKVLARIKAHPENELDCLHEEKKQSQKGKKILDYSVFSMCLEVKKEKVLLSNIFNRQLNNLIATYGEDTSTWINLPVEITGIENNGYFNAVLTPTKEFEEEELK